MEHTAILSNPTQAPEENVPLAALHVVVLETDAFIVGAANAGMGLHRHEGAGQWTSLGWRNIRSNGLDWDRSRPHILYLAAGNGLLRSTDAGASWRITTGWDITEVQDVAVDPYEPDTLYIATAYGVLRSADQGETWTPASRGIPEPRCTFSYVLQPDVSRKETIIVGTEDGLYRSEDGAGIWRPVGPRDVAIRDLRQSLADPKLWLAGTEDRGVLMSRDGGAAWSFIGAPFRDATIYSVALAPFDAGRMAVGGFGTGVFVSGDGGITWRTQPESLGNRHVHALAFDPNDSGRLWAGTVGGGVFQSDGDSPWTYAGLDGATVWDMTFIPALEHAGSASEQAAHGRPSGQPAASQTFAIGGASVAAPPAPLAAFERRRNELIDYFAERGPSGYIDWVEFIEVAAKLYRDRPLDELLLLLDRLLADPHGDMFWMYPVVLVQYLGLGRLPEAYHQQLREIWRTYQPYRGDTENHWAMYYVSLYLITQLYPDDPGETWFNGRSSQENFAEARDYLISWIGLTVTKGQGEYDSPHYLGFFLVPMALLYAFAADPAMRLRASMMLDYLIADFAVDTLDGLYVGAFSRIYPEPTLDRWKNSSTSFAWLLFGNTPFRPHGVNVILSRPGYRPHGITLVLAVSGYAPPEILYQIATDRSAPYAHRELKRTRHRIRHADERNAPVYKTVYMRREYAVGSTQGGLLQPIQQHTWEVLWATDDPGEGRNVLFTIHPYSSPYELSMYFPDEPKLVTEAVLKGKKETYDSPWKWTGGSPYEQVFQSGSALVALYDIPPGARFPHISAFFSRGLSSTEEDPSGWIFARGGDALIAYYPLAPYQWRDEEGG
ncbi:MAG TPA: hypothetical protein VFG50_13830, partial [Rhodothermales bacterium]|nr:hypothetical protein [Rhodothermales bacterium]